MSTTVPASSAESSARTCGMSKEKWSAVKSQAHNALTRGRGVRAENKLSNWGDVAGQGDLFGTDNADDEQEGER